MKKTLITAMMMLCLCGMLIAQTGTTQPAQPSNYLDPDAGTEANPYLISNLTNLRWLSEVSDDWWVNTTTQVHFLQTADIDATETINWNEGQGFIPIHRPWFYWSFIGVYDGANYTINNLYANRDDIDSNWNWGLFLNAITSVFRNIILENVNISGGFVGGIVGGATDSIIDNCYTTGSFLSFTTSFSIPPASIGGIAGIIENSTISNSHSTANMTISEDYLSNWIVIGGIVGIATDSSVDNCSFTGTISNDIHVAVNFIGGISGIMYSSTFTNSHSTADISGSADFAYIAGIVGGGGDDNIITNCYSTGDITGLGTSVYVGGIVGGGGLQPDYSFTITDSHSTGNIFGSSNTDSFSNIQIGGIVGRIDSGQISNCHSTGNISSIYYTAHVGGIAGEI